MNLKLRKAKDHPVYHVLFPDQHTMCYTMLRPQEHYEGVKHRNKVFTWDEYIKWYALDREGAEEYFTYDRNVCGFNIPDTFLRVFFNKFPNKTDRELELYKLLKMFGVWKSKNFYLLATCTKDKKEALNHEIYHSIYYLFPNYKKEVKDLIYRYNGLKSFENSLIKGAGYNPAVIMDELQAYALDSFVVNSFKLNVTKAMKEFKKELKKIVKKYIPKGTDGFFNEWLI